MKIYRVANDSPNALNPKKGRIEKQHQLAFTHSALVMVFMSFMFPINLVIAIWELALCL
ncbi:MAG: hypothetical protein OQL20_04505 [Sedimenticola sp.]|nr:hypothetical protein [Sedimenticola sp.]